MRILGLIPARGGSKGVPRKNVKLLGGKPLIQYTYESAKSSTLLTDIILSSEDDDIIKVAKRLGIDVPFKRPPELALDTTSSVEVVLHAINELEKSGNFYDSVCLLQPTSPFRPSGLIDQAINRFKNAGSDSLVSVLRVPLEYNPHWVFETDDDCFLRVATGDSDLIKRRQDLPEAFFRDGSIYLTKTNIIKDHNSLYGSSIAYIVNNESYYMNIDTMEDWKEAEIKLTKLRE